MSGRLGRPVSIYSGVPGRLQRVHVALTVAIADARDSRLRAKIEAILADLHQKIQHDLGDAA